MMRILRDAVKLDIYDLNWAFSSEQFGLLSSPLSGLPRKGVMIQVLSFGGHLLLSIRRLKIKLYKRLPRHHVLIFTFTKNNLDALQPLEEEIDNSSFIGINGKVSTVIPMFVADFISIFYFPRLLKEMKRARDYRRQSYRLALDAYWRTYGYYVVCRYMLRRLAPASLVVSNDHVFWGRTIAKAASDENIPTVYIQHASVTDKFPALAFDYALLDGRDALLKYDRSGRSSAKVFLTGISKYDRYHPFINKTRQVQAVGICTNRYETTETVEALCSQLNKSLSALRYILRPHPGDERVEAWREVARNHAMDYSDSRKEAAFEFLKRIDVVIAGETNILLEGALLNVYPVYYDFENIQLDAYGFLRNGLVDGRLSQPTELCQTLNRIEKKRPDVRERSKFYCETVDTAFDGRSTALAVALITSIASGEAIDMAGWEPIGGLGNLQAYRPR